MLEADATAFAEAIQRIDNHLHDEIERLEASRKQIAQLAAGDSLALPPEVVSYLDRLRQIGASERLVEGERDGWILVAARWPDRLHEAMLAKITQLEDPQYVRLYRLLSELVESDADDDPRLEEVADIMADLAEQAYTAGELNLDEMAHDDLTVNLLDALPLESDPRAQRLLDLLRERGWAGWTRLERLTEPPDRHGVGFVRRACLIIPVGFVVGPVGDRCWDDGVDARSRLIYAGWLPHDRMFVGTGRWSNLGRHPR